MNMASYPLQAPHTAGRRSIQTRGTNPAEPPCPQERAVAMAETMREILHRDGHVTTEALIGEGYTSAEILEHSEDANHHLRKVLSIDGRAADRVPEIIEKAILATAWIMPLTASTEDTATMRLAWRDYCMASAAHRIDPWVSQSERCLGRLKIFLGLLPLLPREINTVLQAVAVALKRRVLA
ncbi:MAG: hypothetical protein LCH86_07560 [Proteobacteria bacterium]|nr:hypothetical protein [Pseudomonadota bacterium]